MSVRARIWRELGKFVLQYSLSTAFWMALYLIVEHAFGLGWIVVVIGLIAWIATMVHVFFIGDASVAALARKAYRVRQWKRDFKAYIDSRDEAAVEAQPIVPPAITHVRDGLGNLWERTDTNLWDFVEFAEGTPFKPGRITEDPKGSRALGWGLLSRRIGPLTPVEAPEHAQREETA